MCFIARAELKGRGGLGAGSVVETTGAVLGVAEVVLEIGGAVLGVVLVVLEATKVVVELSEDDDAAAPPDARVDTESSETPTGETVVHAPAESAVRSAATTSTPVARRRIIFRRRPCCSRRSRSGKSCRVTRPRGSGMFIPEV
jgi:hypothetical protein